MKKYTDRKVLANSEQFKPMSKFTATTTTATTATTAITAITAIAAVSAIVLLSLCLLPLRAEAQTGHSTPLQFNEVVHNFGKFSVDDGEQKCEFRYTNTGKSAVAIYNILSSCGCTEPSWSKAPIRPGESGVIKVTYLNDQGPYPFDKTLTVYTSASEKPIILRITGVVYEKDRPLSESFPARFGPLGMKFKVQNGGQIEQGLYKSCAENIVNLSGKSITVKFANASKGLSIKVSPAVLKPGDVGKITYSINTKAALHWGTTRYTADIICGGKIVRPKFMTECMILTPYSSKTSGEIDNGPQIFADKSTVEFGSAKVGEKIPATFSLVNSGKKMLRIYKIETNGASIQIHCPSYIAAGGKFTLKAIATPRKKQLNEVYTITLITNSPERPLVNLFLSGDIK